MKVKKRRKGIIPVCRSEYLQDVTIAFGRRAKAVRYANRTLEFEALQESGDASHEKLTIEARTLSGVVTKIAIWDDGIAWVFQRHQIKSKIGPAFELHADFSGMDAEWMAELIRQSLVDLSGVKDIWIEHKCREG